jgi:hypothetical protein
MSTPAERLCSRSWRLRNSVWLAPAVLLVGFATWASFLYIGLKAKNRAWLVAAGLYGVAAVVTITLISTYSDGVKETSTAGEGIASVTMVVVWIVGVVHGFITNRQWLLWKSRDDNAGPWYGHQTGHVSHGGLGAVPAPTPDDLLRGGAHLVGTGGSTPASAPGSPPPPPPSPPPPPPPSFADPIDVNAASPHDLTTRLGLAADVASAVIAQRDRIGGFSTPDQLMTVAGVPPHVYAGIRDQVVVRSAPADGDRPLTRGRRLEF